MQKNHQRAIMNLLPGREIIFSPALAKVAGDLPTSIFLSQLLYWTGKGRNKDWIYKTIEEFEEETTLTRIQQDRVIKKLKTLKLIEVKLKGCPPKRHFKINEEELVNKIYKIYR